MPNARADLPLRRRPGPGIEALGRAHLLELREPMTLEDRMDAAMADLERRWKGKRRPKAFYLTQEDFDAFMATDPPTVETTFGNNPPQRWTEPAYRGVPVRLTKSRTSRLYDDPTAQGRALP
jgi:hypothetical protein